MFTLISSNSIVWFINNRNLFFDVARVWTSQIIHRAGVVVIVFTGIEPGTLRAGACSWLQ